MNRRINKKMIPAIILCRAYFTNVNSAMSSEKFKYLHTTQKPRFFSYGISNATMRLETTQS